MKIISKSNLSATFLVIFFLFINIAIGGNNLLPEEIKTKMITEYGDYLGHKNKEEIIKHIKAKQYDFNGDGHLDWLVYFERIHCGSSGCHGPVYIFNKLNNNYCFAGYSYPEAITEKITFPEMQCK